MSDDQYRLDRNKTGTGQCPTGKRSYVNRKIAKGDASYAARTGVPGLRPYRCLECDQWHLGFLPQPVIRGTVSAADYYGSDE